MFACMYVFVSAWQYAISFILMVNNSVLKLIKLPKLPKLSKLCLVSCSLITALYLTACTTTAEECDPSKDPGFFNKIGCAVSGSYEERVEIKQQKVADLKAENARLNALIRQIQDANAQLKGQYAQRVKALDKINEDLFFLERSLSNKKALSADLEKKLAEAKKQVADMKQTKANASLLEKQMKIDELESTLEELHNLMLDSSL